MIQTNHKLLNIYSEGTKIGKIVLNGPNGTYLHEFRLFGEHSENSEVSKIYILRTGVNYSSFEQNQYLEAIRKGLQRALNCEIEFRNGTPKVMRKKSLGRLLRILGSQQSYS